MPELDERFLLKQPLKLPKNSNNNLVNMSENKYNYDKVKANKIISTKHSKMNYGL